MDKNINSKQRPRPNPKWKPGDNGEEPYLTTIIPSHIEETDKDKMRIIMEKHAKDFIQSYEKHNVDEEVIADMNYGISMFISSKQVELYEDLFKEKSLSACHSLNCSKCGKTFRLSSTQKDYCECINFQSKTNITEEVENLLKDIIPYISFTDDPNGAGDWSCNFCGATQRARWENGDLKTYTEFKHKDDCIFIRAKTILSRKDECLK